MNHQNPPHKSKLIELQPEEMLEIIENYQQRTRRFGGI